MMKKLFLLTLSFICLAGFQDAFAQRSIGGHSIMLDDGAGHTYTIMPPSLTGNVTYSLPTIPAGNPQAGFVVAGASAGQTLYWNSTNSDWEASSVIQNNVNGNGTNVTITAPINLSSANISGLTASQVVVTDASKNLASLPYAVGNTSNSLVERDGSGNFTAGTITANGHFVANGTLGTGSPSSTAIYPDVQVHWAGFVKTNLGTNAQILKQYGNWSVSRTGVGTYTVIFDPLCPAYPIINVTPLSGGAIIATPSFIGFGASNQVNIDFYDTSGNHADPQYFYFTIVGGLS